MGVLYHKLKTQSIAPEDGRNYRPKHVALIGINNKPLLLHLVGCLYYLLINSSCHTMKHTDVSLTRTNQILNTSDIWW